MWEVIAILAGTLGLALIIGAVYFAKAIGYMLGNEDAKDNAIKNGKILKNGVFYEVKEVK